MYIRIVCVVFGGVYSARFDRSCQTTIGCSNKILFILILRLILTKLTGLLILATNLLNSISEKKVFTDINYTYMSNFAVVLKIFTHSGVYVSGAYLI